MEQENGVIAQDPVAQQGEVAKEAKPQEGSTAAEARSFGQDEVNRIVQERLQKEREGTLKRFGVESLDQLEEALKKTSEIEGLAKEKQELQTKYDELSKGYDEARRELLFIENDIDPSRRDDVLAIIGSKGLELNKENIQELLKTHPEWERPHITAKVGIEGERTPPKRTDQDDAEDFFGVKFGKSNSPIRM